MFSWIKKFFGDSSKILVTAAVAVAKARVLESLNKTDKFNEAEKAVFAEAIEAFITELLAEVTK